MLPCPSFLVSMGIIMLFWPGCCIIIIIIGIMSLSPSLSIIMFCNKENNDLRQSNSVFIVLTIIIIFTGSTPQDLSLAAPAEALVPGAAAAKGSNVMSWRNLRLLSYLHEPKTEVKTHFCIMHQAWCQIKAHVPYFTKMSLDMRFGHESSKICKEM